MSTSQQDIGGKAAELPNVHSLSDVKVDERIEPMRVFEQRIEALYKILGNKPDVLPTSMLRKGIEDLPTQVFQEWGYYARWGASLARAGVQLGWWSDGDLREATLPNSDAQQQPPADFAPGTRVYVRHENEPIPWRRPHLRTPGYVHGQIGVVQRRLDDEADQDIEAHQFIFNGEKKAVPKRPVYRVAFRLGDIWPRLAGELESPNDEVLVEIFADWLAPATDAAKATTDADKTQIVTGHSHQHTEDHGDHVHEARAEVEQTARNREGAPQPGERFCLALSRLAVAKGLVSEAEIAAKIESLQHLAYDRAQELVVRCWTDAEFKRRVLDEALANQVVKDTLGIELTCKFVVVEDTDALKNVVCCTLCSCFPTQLLGRAPSWYKEASYRSRICLEPRKVLREFGTEIAKERTVRIVDSTSECRYMVLPRRPPNTDNLSDEELRKLITRDSLIGVRELF